MSLSLKYSKEQYNELIGIIGQFIALKTLVSVDVRIIRPNCVSCDEYPLIFKNGLSRISDLLPQLRIVFLNVLRFWVTDVWVFSDHWECKTKGCQLANYALVTNSEPPPWAQYMQ
jgi:hypothetical protein